MLLLVVVVIDDVVYDAILFVELSPNEEEEEALTDADPADAAATDCILR